MATNSSCLSRCPISFNFLLIIVFIIVLLSLTSSNTASLFVICSIHRVPIIHVSQPCTSTPNIVDKDGGEYRTDWYEEQLQSVRALVGKNKTVLSMHISRTFRGIKNWQCYNINTIMLKFTDRAVWTILNSLSNLQIVSRWISIWFVRVRSSTNPKMYIILYHIVTELGNLVTFK